MKCPYNSNYITVHIEKPLRYFDHATEDASGCPEVLHMWQHDSSDTTEFHLHDCLKEECAAWQNGHCVRTA